MIEFEHNNTLFATLPETINGTPLYNGNLLMKWLELDFEDLLNWHQKTDPMFEFHNDVLYMDKDNAMSLVNFSQNIQYKN